MSRPIIIGEDVFQAAFSLPAELRDAGIQEFGANGVEVLGVPVRSLDEEGMRSYVSRQWADAWESPEDSVYDGDSG